MINRETLIYVLQLCLLRIVFVRCEIVETRLGKLEGGERMSRNGRPYLYWTKVPYAKPPIGKLRLASPEPVDKWEGVFKATELGPQCPQINIFSTPVPVGQEDCLYLSVYKPKTDKNNLPVTLYIHGGSFVFGYPGYKGFADNMMDEDVILVAFEYRLGALGYMSLNDTLLPGNFGLKDQAFVLNWVYDNIANFGGDPKRIILFGESTGAASSHYLTLLPQTADKVAGVYLISGSLTKAWSYLPVSLVKEFSEKLLDKIGCHQYSVEETLECLRDIEDPMLFVNVTFPMIPKGTEKLALSPTIEPPGPNALLTEDMTKHRILKTKPIVASFTIGEFLISELPDMVNNYSRTMEISKDPLAYTQYLLSGVVNEEMIKDDARRVKEQYLTKQDIPILAHQVAELFADMDMVYPSFDLTEKHEGPKWMYILAHRMEPNIMEVLNNHPAMPELIPIPGHADDLTLYFNMMESYEHTKPRSDDARVSKEMVKYLANFATHGNPTPDGSPFIWKPYEGNEVLIIKTEGNFYADNDFIRQKKEAMAFFRNVNWE